MWKLIILRFKLLCVFWKSAPNCSIEIPLTGKRNIFVFLGADYGNLGDVAITYAQTKFLKDNFKNDNIIEIPISQTFAAIKIIKREIRQNDIITLIGGGNTSDLYDDIEFLRQLVIWNFRRHVIIGFPQTFDLSETAAGRFTSWTIKAIYNRARKLFIYARETNTFNVIRKRYPNINVEMLPDIVMSLDERQTQNRKGILLCLRSDKEKSTNKAIIDNILAKLNQIYRQTDIADNQINAVTLENRYSLFHEQLGKFRKHEVVLTDRLHGMIFAFITGTPAYVFDNSNHKISACYQWIKDCGYIQLVKSADDVLPFSKISNFEHVHSQIITRIKKSICLKLQ